MTHPNRSDTHIPMLGYAATEHLRSLLSHHPDVDPERGITIIIKPGCDLCDEILHWSEED